MIDRRIVTVDRERRLRAVDGGMLGELWGHRQRVATREGVLEIEILASEVVPLPAANDQEPRVGALARWCQAVRGREAVVLLHRPGTVFAPAQAPLLQGVRLLAIEDAADEALWDAALDVGLPVWGARGELRCEIAGYLPPVTGVCRALAMGSFAAEDGLRIQALDEERDGVRWHWSAPAATAVIVAGGYEAERIDGARGEWRDRGSEGWVRLAARSAAGTVFTQPRFCAGRPGHG